jgi:hypothetical protein
MSKPSAQAKSRVRERAPFDGRSVDLSKLKNTLAAKDLAKLVGKVTFPFLPIETLSVTKTIGKGRTNLTIIESTIVQVDATSPRASFDRTKSPRNPVIQIHFEAIAYGITSIGTYIIEFVIQTFGASTFNLDGFAGAGTVLNRGPKTLNGLVGVSLVLKNVLPTQQTFAFLEQTGGGAWDWLFTQVRFPDIVAQP